MDRNRKQELDLLIKEIVLFIKDKAQNEYDNNFNATGMSGSHGNLDKRISRLIREYKNSIRVNQPFNFIEFEISDQNELKYVQDKLSARAKKFEHDGKDKNHPFK